MADVVLDLARPRGHVRALPPACRWVLHGAPGDLAWPGGLPREMLRSTAAESHAALMLGPDEWLLIAPVDTQAPTSTPAAPLVDISDRNVAFEIAGPAARALLNAGNPLDLADPAFPAGMATRTVFGKAEVVLWRPGTEPVWRMEVWRSFASYVVRFLEQAVMDL